MSRRCVVYLRVSTPSQTLGSGLIRQLEDCTRYARENGLHIVGVFGDACSGDGLMPNRSLAYVSSQTLRCPILAESPCRWSRMSYGTDPLVDANVVFTSKTHAEFSDTCDRIIADEIRRVTHVRLQVHREVQE